MRRRVGLAARGAGRISGWAGLAAGLLLASGCAHAAQEAGKQAAQGAIAGAGEKADHPKGQQQLEKATEGVSQGALRGTLQQLEDPDQRQQLRALIADVAGTAARQATAGALAQANTPAQRAAAAQLAREAAQGAAQAFVAVLSQQLGPDGDGPLARTIAASGERIAGASARGVSAEVSGLFPACQDAQGADRASCIQSQIEAFSRAASAGAVQGMGRSLVPLAIAFVAGLLIAVLVLGAWSSLRGWSATRIARRQPA